MSEPSSACDRTAYVVLGCHRSGTSAMARVLNLCGLGAVPADLLPPHPIHNPTGFWEARPVVELNDAILTEGGGTWDRPPSRPAVTTSQVERAVDLLTHQFPRSGSIVLKDPRISLLVPVWHEALGRIGLRPVYIVMLRHPDEVAASFAARDAFGGDRALALWGAYTVAAERSTRGRARLLVTFDDLLADWKAVLAHILVAADRSPSAPGADVTAAVMRFLTPNLKRRHRSETASDKADEGREHRLFRLLSTDAETAAAQAELDAFDDDPSPRHEDRVHGRSLPERPDPVSWLLVTGAPRSGTSLLRAMLVEHPNVALLQEYGLTRLVHGIDAIVARPAAAGADWDAAGEPTDTRFNAASAFYRDRPGRAAVTRGGGDPEPGHFHDVAAGLFSGMFQGRALRVVGDKMPIRSDWEDLPLLSARLPGFRIVAVIRNPADVVRSSLVRREATRRGRDAWPIETVEEAAAQWIAAWRRLIALKRRYGPSVLVVKYEDLCARPQATMDAVTAWLGLSAHRVSTPIASLPPHLALHTASEQAVLDRLLAPIIDAWPAHDEAALMTRFEALKSPYRLGTTVRLSDEEATPYLTSGFSFREEWGRWTDGPLASLTLPHGLPRGLLLVEIGVVQTFGRDGDPCDVVLKHGWGEPKLFVLGPGASRIAFVTQAEETQESGLLTIEIIVARPKTPDESPADSRALGILIESLRVTRLPDRPLDTSDG